ncbi:MAG: methyltransferase domain-containing protein [Candidatus Magasanikbacteria bacterium]
MELKQTNNQLTTNCLITGEPVVKILGLGMHPYADTFIGKEQLGLSEPVLPLEVYLNANSGQIQLGYMTNDFDRYNLYSYSYTSSNSQFSRDHWDNYYKTVRDRFGIVNKKVIEIGSNDGYLLNNFLPKNLALGVDSSEKMCEISSEKGIDTINAIFNQDLAENIEKKYGKFELIIANNVLNHSNDPLDFVKGVSDLLSDDGVFVFELPYWKDTIQSKKFDQIYHEHVSYFTIKSSYNLLKAAGLEIFDYDNVDYHGGSIRVYSRKSSSPKLMDKIAEAIRREDEIGLFRPETYIEWQKKLLISRNLFLRRLFDIKINQPNIPIIGVGAAAKANTFLNYYRIDASVLDYITDSSEYKQGKFTPLTRIPIVSDDVFGNYDEVYALILSWNISDGLKKILLKINSKIKFIEI